jgi:hypothetical protein
VSAQQVKWAARPMTDSACESILRSAVEETERIETQIEPDWSEQLRSARVWRLEQLTGLGFDHARATLMADDARVDLAQARKLIALGCPLETAARILL